MGNVCPNYSDLIDKREGNLTPARGCRSRLTFQPRPHGSTRCPVNAVVTFDLQMSLLSSTRRSVQLQLLVALQAWLLRPGLTWWWCRHVAPAGILLCTLLSTIVFLFFFFRKEQVKRHHHSPVLFQRKENIITAKH